MSNEENGFMSEDEIKLFIEEVLSSLGVSASSIEVVLSLPPDLPADIAAICQIKINSPEFNLQIISVPITPATDRAATLKEEIEAQVSGRF